MKLLGCAPYPQTRRHPRTAGGADAPHLCTSKRYDPKADELLLGTDAVDVVVKATVARAGQIAARNRKQHRRARAVNGRDERGLVIVPMFGRAATQCQRSANRKITANKSFGARWKRAAAKSTAIRSPRRRSPAMSAAQ